MGAAGPARLDREFGYERFRTRLVGLLRGAFADVPTAAFSESVARERQ
jgi:hypothetical protein